MTPDQSHASRRVDQARANRRAAALVAHKLHNDAEGRQAILDEVLDCRRCTAGLIDMLVHALLMRLRLESTDDDEIRTLLRKVAMDSAYAETTGTTP